MKKNKKNGFTLVELLAVIVILAIILVIAVPKVMSIIKDVRISTLESTAKLVALSAEKKKVENEIVGNNEVLTCENVVKINDIDYDTCDIEFDGNTAKVTIKGKGNFKGMNACEATKNNANITERCLNKKVEVTLELNGGSATNITGIYEEGTILDIEEPIKENSTFLEYKIVSGDSIISNNKLTVGSTNTIIHAMYESWPTLAIDLDGGIDNITYNEKYKSGTIIELEVPTKTGYTFTGWNVENGNGVVSGNTLTMGSENTIIKALWIINTYKVTFNPNGGTLSTTYKNVAYNDTYGEMPTPVKEGYIFIGWYNSNNKEVISTDKVEIVSDIELYAKYIKNEFAYTGNFETFVVPYDGNYKIELWGAQGGSYNEQYQGGYGGYSKGEIVLTKNEVLYINVGGQPKNNTLLNTYIDGGYNGGGANGTRSDLIDNGGGGASSISYKNGLLYELENYKEYIIAVAGGGGGVQYTPTYYETRSSTAGHGGGYIGNSATTMCNTCDCESIGTGGTQDSGGNRVIISYNTELNNYTPNMKGSFGLGSNGDIDNAIRPEYNKVGGSGGGGGFYGGSGNSCVGSGGGGSGYIGNSKLTNKYMSCYECKESKEESTYTNSVKCSNQLPTENCAKLGNGYVKITYIG